MADYGKESRTFADKRRISVLFRRRLIVMASAKVVLADGEGIEIGEIELLQTVDERPGSKSVARAAKAAPSKSLDDETDGETKRPASHWLSLLTHRPYVSPVI